MEILPLSLDTVFKKAFGDPIVFTAFVEAVLGIQIKIKRVETDKKYTMKIGNIVPRFDLYAEDVEQRIIVEMQSAHLTDHFDRFLHYHCLSILEQARNAKNYQPPQTVYTIVMLINPRETMPDFGVIDFDPRTPEGVPYHKIKHKVIYLCPKSVPAHRPEPYKQWMRLIIDSLDERIEANEYINDPMERVLQLAQYSSLSAVQLTQLKDDYHQQEQERLKFAEGEAKGRLEGKAEGKAEGEAETNRRVVYRMADAGFGAEQIATFTALMVDDVKQLLNEKLFG